MLANKEALENASQREEYLKNMHNNCFLHVQKLINQKAISASAGSTKKEENKPAAREEEHKQQIEKICKNCNEPFFY